MSLCRLILTALLTPAALVAAAEPSLPPAAAQELAAIKDYLNTRALPAVKARFGHEGVSCFRPQVEECLSLIAAFERSGRVDETSEPHRMSMLHLACLFRQPALARALLAAGADPNARARNEFGDCEGNTPLISCLHDAFPGLPPADAATHIALLDALAAAGADVRGAEGSRALLHFGASDAAGAEEVALHLLELGAGIGEHVTGGSFLASLQRDADLARLLASGKARLLDAMSREGKLKPFSDNPNHDLLLMLLRYGSSSDVENLASGVERLLRLGADVHCKGGNDETSADCIHRHLRLSARLAARGLRVPHSPRVLRAASLADDLAALPLYAHVCPPPETLAPHWDAFARLFTAPLTPEERQHEGRTSITPRERLLPFMAAVDAARTADFVMQLPQWQAKRAWTDEEKLGFRLLLQAEGVRLPADWLQSTAERLDAAGMSREAHELIHLLARLEDAAPVAESLCQSPRPAIASAAWSVRLQAAGFSPLPNWSCARADEAARKRLGQLERALWALGFSPYRRDGGHFIDFTHAASDSNVSREALPGLNRAELLWLPMPFGYLPADREQLLDSLREQGLGEAADFCTELFRMREHLLAEEAPGNGDEASDPEADYEEPDPMPDAAKEIKVSQLRALAASSVATRQAFAIEAALGRLMWELWQQNTENAKNNGENQP